MSLTKQPVRQLVMMKTIAFITMSFCIVVAYASAGQETDLNQLTAKCVRAAQNYRPIQKDFLYKVLHTVEYAGWIGDADGLKLRHPIAMAVRYAGSRKQGHYWYLFNPQKKFAITVKTDMDGNINLIANDKEMADYTFQGTMKKGIIMGLWKNGDLNQSFALYVYPTNQADQ